MQKLPDAGASARAPGRARRRLSGSGGLEILQSGLYLRPRLEADSGGITIPLLVQRCACFLHSLSGNRDGTGERCQRRGREVSRTSHRDALIRSVEERVECLDAPFRFTACGGLLVRGLAGGSLGALAGIEREMQRLAIVALGGRRLGSRQGTLRVGQHLGGELGGTGGPRGVDGALGLIHLLAGRFAAAPGGDQREDERDAPHWNAREEA